MWIFKKFITYSRLSFKMAFLICFLNSSMWEFAFAHYFSREPVSNLFTSCVNLMCEKQGLIIILVCFPLIIYEILHFFTLAICPSFEDYLLMSSFIPIWSIYWLRRLLYIFHMVLSCYVCYRYSLSVYIFLFSLWGLLPFQSLMYSNVFILPFLLLH